MFAKHVDDDMPSFLIVDVDHECGDGIVGQRHERRFLLWLWFLSSRAWAGHVCKNWKDEGVVCSLGESIYIVTSNGVPAPE